MSTKYFLRVKGKILGPFSMVQLKDLHARGRLSTFHEVSQDGKSWVEAASLSEVFPQEESVAVEEPAEAPREELGFFFFDASGTTRGPITFADLTTLFRVGQVNVSTLVWRQGMPQWQPLQSVMSGVAPPLPPPLPNQSSRGAVGPGFSAGQSTPSNDLQYFHPALAILFHYLTIGLFTFFWLNLLHSKLPVKRSSDPSGGKAIGFYYIPLFNCYWVFFVYHRLCLRINEQRHLHGLSGGIPMALTVLRSFLLLMFIIWFCLALQVVSGSHVPSELMLICFLVMLLEYLLISPIFVGIVQSNINDLVRSGNG